MLYKFTNVFFPFITTIYISHILMADGIGTVARSQNIAQYFVLLAPLGLLNYGTREIALARDDSKAKNKLCSELLCINFVSTVIFSVLYYVVLYQFFVPKISESLFLVSGLPIIFNVFNVDWYYQGTEKYSYIAKRGLTVRFLSFIFILCFVKDKNDCFEYALIYSIGIAGNHIFNIVNLFRDGFRLQLKSINIVIHLKPVFVFLCSNIAVELYVLFDTTMLGYYCSSEIVGYYTNSIKLVKIVVGLISAVGSILLPRLSYYKSYNMHEEISDLISKVSAVVFFFSVPTAIGIFMLSKEIVGCFFGASFIPAITTQRIATGLILVMGFGNLFGTQVLVTFNQEKKLLLCTCIGAVTNFLLNLILIPSLQHNGATIASVISETTVAILAAVMSRKYVKIRFKKSFIFSTVVSSGIMGLVVYGINFFIINDLLSLISSVLIGGIIYFIMIALQKNYLFTEIKDMILKKKSR